MIPNMDAQVRAQQKVRSFHTEFLIVIWKLNRSTVGLSSTLQYLDSFYYVQHLMDYDFIRPMRHMDLIVLSFLTL